MEEKLNVDMNLKEKSQGSDGGTSSRRSQILKMHQLNLNVKPLHSNCSRENSSNMSKSPGLPRSFKGLGFEHSSSNYIG